MSFEVTFVCGGRKGTFAERAIKILLREAGAQFDGKEICLSIKNGSDSRNFLREEMRVKARKARKVKRHLSSRKMHDAMYGRKSK